ncbi:relaxase/mobilization nuclease domain-containing protein [Microbaculum marinisediminis]|uniref:Relaxase/mobilization nuclease domain-containing protein n=1 Tax=Microbaculum marinisediminis TaxID=2931392 RepID=A0AAW5QUX4_9HYPH|nr:relaxase/mobilization nuclease domain-containing protein [Microbaculum sp. A6E488]MCT8970782.1 relaxase/mobilization nuclease domain-containing protein [Microbaculum sp. A6E488]
MILKASERGDAPQLARYLLSMRDNDHVELHDVRGFVSDDLVEAFGEADAIARGTRCKNHLFSMSLNPPEGANVSVEGFERAIAQVEEKLGLENQPRAIVFHEKDGRRHAHVVWSRIDTEQMRAINMSHYKTRLRDISRQLYLEHEWDMPRGLQDRSLRDPLNFTRQEWQQSKRAGLDPREIKTVFRQCWQASDNKVSFERALKERGFWLAKGDRRGFVAVDYRGEVYSLSRYAGVKAKDLEARLGNPKRLRAVGEVKTEIASGMTQQLQAHIKDAERDAKHRMAVIAFRKMEMASRHRDERQKLWAAHEKRWQAETRQRAERLPRGISGIWHRLTGRYAKVRAQNEAEALQAWQRDRVEKDTLVFKQIEERQTLQRDGKAQRSVAQHELMQLREDVANYRTLDRDERDRRRERIKEEKSDRRKRTRDQRSRRRGFEP